MISYRRSMLRVLREQDYKKYEWLLEKLNLLYKPMPHDAHKGVMIPKENVERKASIERLTDLWCDELKRHRLNAYKRQLVKEQPGFLLRKASIERLTDLWCDELKRHRLNAYKRQLVKEQP